MHWIPEFILIAFMSVLILSILFLINFYLEGKRDK